MGIVQTKQGSIAGTSLAITLDNPTGANSLIVVIAASGTSSNPTAIACTLGGVTGNFVQDSTFGSASDAAVGATWRDQPCVSGQTAVGITATGGTGTIAIMASVYECDDLAASPFDKTANNVGLSGAAWTSNATPATTAPSERLFGAVFTTVNSAGTITGPSSPWINLAMLSLTQGSFLDRWMSGSQDVAATGTYTYNGTVSPNSDWIAKIVTYKLLTGPVASGGVAHRREHRQKHVGRRHRMQHQQKMMTFGVTEAAATPVLAVILSTPPTPVQDAANW